MDAHEIFSHALTCIAVSGAVVCGLVILAVTFGDVLKRAWDAIGARRVRSGILVLAAWATLFGGAKHMIGNVTFPLTDESAWYLKNTGSSYVTNDAVFVSLQRNPVVPLTANVFVDGLALSYTNDTDWAAHSFTAYSNTLAAAGTEFFVAWPAATNFSWIVYTDWVPPPTVHTNGIAYVLWQRPSVTQSTNAIAMTRTGVYVNSFRMSPDPAITNGPNAGVSLTLTQGGTDDEE